MLLTACILLFTAFEYHRRPTITTLLYVFALSVLSMTTSLGGFLATFTLDVMLAVALTVSFIALECYLTQLDDETLAFDLEIIGGIYNINTITGQTITSREVEEQYALTTDRDYALLERIMGPGMHTRLGNDNATQFNYVMHEIQATNATQVLEIGCGRGHSRVLAQMMPNVQFTGIDLVERHIEVAKSRGLANLEYIQADATTDISWLGKNRFQIIFGVESLCHMDSDEKRSQFIANVKSLIAPGGRLVIVDGFRSNTFATASPNQQKAMMLAESGFAIMRMPSKTDWIQAAQGVVTSNKDLTADAMPYWILGWRIARFIMVFPIVMHYYSRRSRATMCTIMNLLSVATVAHAMRNSAAAEYGVLVVSFMHQTDQ